MFSRVSLSSRIRANLNLQLQAWDYKPLSSPPSSYLIWPCGNRVWELLLISSEASHSPACRLNPISSLWLSLVILGLLICLIMRSLHLAVYFSVSCTAPDSLLTLHLVPSSSRDRDPLQQEPLEQIMTLEIKPEVNQQKIFLITDNQIFLNYPCQTCPAKESYPEAFSSLDGGHCIFVLSFNIGNTGDPTDNIYEEDEHEDWFIRYMPKCVWKKTKQPPPPTNQEVRKFTEICE